MTNNPGAATAKYAIRTYDGRVLAYGPSGGDVQTIPPPPRPVNAYPPSVRPQEFCISQLEPKKNIYNINALIERNRLLYDQLTAPQKWVITLVPVPDRVVVTIQTEDGQLWIAPKDVQEGQIRVEPVVYDDASKYREDVLFELSPLKSN
ncbi:hypothetical protein EDD15DRAFT_2361587 [Pisolithus albus]|nr:hypothetical protein EDD15DRAFT_2361587 [Pisolithus albus]